MGRRDDHARANLLRTALRGVVGLALRVFFRRLETVGEERVPADGPVMFVLNHPNALVDPGIALIMLPRPVAFLAKSTLWKIPVVATFVRAFDSIPVYRRQDAAGDKVDNSRTFAAARALLERGGAIAIFPEGVSHSAPRLQPVKTGAARIALGSGLAGLSIVPVGLDYGAKQTFRSDALLYFGAPIRVEPLPPELLAAGLEPPRDAVAELTASIERALAEVTLQADHEEALRLANWAEQIVTSIQVESAGADPTSGERFELRRRILDGYHVLKGRHRARVETLMRRIAGLEQALHALGLDELLDQSELDATLVPGPWRLVELALLTIPGLIGALIHYPAYRLVGTIATRYARAEDDMVATLKVLAAMLLFPATWLAVTVGVAMTLGRGPALATAVVAPLLGYTAMIYFELIERFAQALRALLLLRHRPAGLEHLRRERQWIYNELVALGELAAARRP